MPISASLVGAFDRHLAGDIGEAEKICIGALHSDRGNADALHLMGHIAASRGQYDTATALIARAIGAAPGRGDLHAGLGNVFAARQLHEGVRDSYRRALLRTYFTQMPASLSEIFSHAGHEDAAQSFVGDARLYKSRFYQDVLLDRWLFEGLRDAVFADIGGPGGETYSNTHFFETVRGWRGLRIAPSLDVCARLHEIAQSEGIVEITYLNINSEEHAHVLLQAIAFDQLRVHALTATCGEHEAEPMRVTMAGHGFDLARRLGGDLLFLNRTSPVHAAFAKLRGRNSSGENTLP